MTVKVTIPLNADGSPRRHPVTGAIWPHLDWTADHPGHTEDDGCGVCLPLPAQGTVTLADGTRYELVPDGFEFLPGHGGPLLHHIERQIEGLERLNKLARYEEDGTPVPDSGPFVHTCTEACGAEADPSDS